MPEAKTLKRAKKAEREGKAPTTVAGEFVREEIDHVRRGKHGARSPKQAIAIGLSKARRAGVPLPPPRKGQASETTRRKAQQDTQRAKQPPRTSARRSQATRGALAREGHEAASSRSLSEQARRSNRARVAAKSSRRPRSRPSSTAKRGASNRAR
jgi:hypothetical protein